MRTSTVLNMDADLFCSWMMAYSELWNVIFGGDHAFPDDPRYNRIYYVHKTNPLAVTETTERDIEAVIVTLAK